MPSIEAGQEEKLEESRLKESQGDFMDVESLVEKELAEADTQIEGFEKENKGILDAATDSSGVAPEILKQAMDESKVEEEISELDQEAEKIHAEMQAEIKMVNDAGVVRDFEKVDNNFEEDPEFQRLMEKIKQGELDYVFENIDKFSDKPWVKEIVSQAFENGGMKFGLEYVGNYIDEPWGKMFFESYAHKYAGVFFQVFPDIQEEAPKEYLRDVFLKIFNRKPEIGAEGAKYCFDLLSDEEVEKIVSENYKKISSRGIEKLIVAAGTRIDNQLMKLLIREMEDKEGKEKKEGYERKLHNYKETSSYIRDAIENIEERIRSDEYFKRLLIEVEGDEEMARGLQQRRIANLKSVKTYYLSDEEMLVKYLSPSNDSLGMDVYPGLSAEQASRYIENNNLVTPGAFYRSTTHEMAVPEALDKESSIHELGHAVTRSNDGIPIETMALIAEAYLPETKEANPGVNDAELLKWNRYYSNPTEVLTRKMIMDIELDFLGIKQYGERFTQEHYKKLTDHIEQGGAASRATHDLLKHIRPKYFERIFNEIAVNQEERSKNEMVA